MIIFDLTHTITETTPLWNEGDEIELSTSLDYQECTTSRQFRVQNLKMPSGTGTHIDAPAHVDPGGCTVDHLSLQDLIIPLVIIDISIADAMRQLLVDDIALHEKNYGIIASCSFVIVKTGWSRYWGDAKQYRNQYQFPSVSKEAAALLLARNVVGLGIDTLSSDGPDTQFPVHALFLGAGKYLLENLLIPDTIAPIGLMAYVMPLKIKGATEAPCRVFAIQKEEMVCLKK